MDIVGALNSSVNAICKPSIPNIFIMGFRASIPMVLAPSALARLLSTVSVMTNRVEPSACYLDATSLQNVH